MTIFKTTLRIVRSFLLSLLIYLALPFLMTMLFISSSATTQPEYKTSSINYAAYDHDQSLVSKALLDHIAKTNTPHDIPEQLDEIRDALFYGQIDYVLEIPEGFGDAVLAGAPDIPLAKQTAPTSILPQALDNQIERFVTTVQRFASADRTATTAETLERALAVIEVPSRVTTVDVGQAADTDALAVTFRFIAYTLLNLSFSIISQTLLAFRQRQIMERNLVSATSPTTINRQLVVSIMLVSLSAFALNLLPLFFVLKTDFWQTPVYLLLGNVLCFALVAISMGFLASTIFRQNSGASNGLQVVVPLLMSFFAGIFVPLEFIPERIRQIGSFMPTYWYNDSIIALENAVQINGELTRRFVRNGAIQLAFAVVLFIVYFLVEFRRQKARVIVAAANA